MTTIAIIGLTYRAEKKSLLLALDSLGLAGVYDLNMLMLFILK